MAPPTKQQHYSLTDSKRDLNVGEQGVHNTHPFPDMFDLGSHNAALGVLVPHPVLSAAVDHTTATALQHVSAKEGRRH